MTNINTVVMCGNLTKDVEIRQNVAKISIAVNESQRDQQGNWMDVPSFFDWIKFIGQNENVQNLQQKLVKGTPVTLMGRAKQNVWQDQTGANRYSISFTVKSLEIHARPQPAQSQQNYGNYQNQQYQQPQQYQQRLVQQRPAPAQQNIPGGPETFDDSDIPF